MRGAPECILGKDKRKYLWLNYAVLGITGVQAVCNARMGIPMQRKGLRHRLEKNPHTVLDALRHVPKFGSDDYAPKFLNDCSKIWY